MSKKNSSVILKNSFKDFSDLSKVYLKFKSLLNLKGGASIDIRKDYYR